jgi:pimeloyl-ACP methyl ester carboxylesterase
MDGAVADLEKVMDAYALDLPAVGGHSLGGMVAVEYARHHRDCRATINLDGFGMGRADQYVGKDEISTAAWMAAQQARAERFVSGRLHQFIGQALRITGRHPADPATLVEITRDVLARDLMAGYQQVSGPVLIVNATAEHSGAAKVLSRDRDNMLQAYRAGLRRDLAALAARQPNIHVAEIDATHMTLISRPQQAAERMLAFLDGR